jgi:hypothetical protein
MANGIPVFESYKEFLIAQVCKNLRKQDPYYVLGLLTALERNDAKQEAADKAEQATNNIRLCQNERNGDNGKAS